MRRDYHFTFPSQAPPPAELRRARLVGFDRMPWPATVMLERDGLVVGRDLYEGPALHLPWPAGDAGRLLVQTGALMARDAPYRLPLEAARGELAKLRNEAADWAQLGLGESAATAQWSKLAHTRFQEAVKPLAPADADAHAALALAAALLAQEELARDFARHAIPARKKAGLPPARIELGYDDTMPSLQDPARLRKLCDGVTIPTPWPELVPAQGVPNWRMLDWRVDWCLQHGLEVTLGPILEPGAIPGWLRQSSVESMQLQALAHLAEMAERYGDRVRRWLPMGRFNAALPPGWSPEDALGLLRFALESLRDRVDDASSIVLVAQPFGEALLENREVWAPVNYADELARLPCPPQALRLEVAMGYGVRGTLCRNALEFSRLFDLYHQFGLDLEAVLHCPAAPQDGVWDHWRGGFAPETQADWLERFALVALGKRNCLGLVWGTMRDTYGQRWPDSGLVALDGAPRPALRRLGALRRATR